MKTSILKDLVIVLGVFALVWTVFSYVDIFPEKSNLQLSVEHEEKLGRLIIDNLLSIDPNYKKISSSLLDSSINIIEKRIMPNIGLTDYDYNIQIVDNPEINAITLPGGNIMIFKGLILASDSPEELTAVLCHEIGHVEKRHVISKLAKEFGITILFTILTGGDASLLNDIVRSSMSTVFDRGQESDADDFALKLLELSNISPKYLGSFFEKMKNDNYDLVNDFDILSTHPNINSRIKKSIEYKVNNDFKEIRFNVNWDKLKESIK